ncbi:hypothetical protein HCB46_08515 [Listeria ivanovii]|uniref:hypothetical protein n=1 Tax=Listeria ivanovii TaxID=1638 RepID=UPI001624E05D|nr:hypothetical protein [Listeria ivanovii]MBC2255512.1 hypothetical protein [Listeria ivanovii]
MKRVALNGQVLDYDTRGLPYPESVKPYFQYEVLKDINNVTEAYNNLSQNLRDRLDIVMEQFQFTLDDLANPQQGEIAKVFGAGGGAQIQLETSVSWYEVLQLVREVSYRNEWGQLLFQVL